MTILDPHDGDAASDEPPTLVENQQALSLLSNEKASLTHSSTEQLEDLVTSESPDLGRSASLAHVNKGLQAHGVVVISAHGKPDAAD